MDPENVLKGRMAETLVDELLRSARNKVYRFGYEAILQNLTQIENAFDGETEVGQQIRAIPDFIILNQSGKPFFVEVKFRSHPEWYRYEREINVLRKIEVFWKAKVILVAPRNPYFTIARPPYFDEQGMPRFVRLEYDQDLNVTGEKLEEFDSLVQRYLVKEVERLATGK